MPDKPGDMAAPLSRGDGRALDKAAEAAAREIAAHFTVLWSKNDPPPVVAPQHRDAAHDAVSAYLSALLSELPEEAVEAGRQAGEEADTVVDEVPAAIRAFLLSLRSSSRGPTDED